jgi:phospholipid/cholesterol/gamma-HCH transport system ATP-binding protein
VIAIGPSCDVLQVDHPFIKQFFLGPRGQRALEVLEQRQAEPSQQE